MKRLPQMFIIAGIALTIQAAMAFPALSQEKAASAKPQAKTDATVQAAPAEKPSAPAATVNGVPILQADLDRGMEGIVQRRAQMGGKIDDAQLKTLKMEVLDNLINRELLNQESKKEKVAITDQQINDKLASIKQRFKGEEEFKKMLDQIKMTEPQIKTQLKEDLAIQELINKQVVDKVNVTDKDIQVYYDAHPEAFKHPEQMKASHILVQVDPKADAAQKAAAHKKIEEIQQKLKKGGDFATLAKEYSDCPSKAKGGDLGYFSKGQMVKPFEDAVMALKPGETSGIVETQFGYHIIKLTDKKPEGIMPLAEVKGQVGQYLKQEKIKKDLKAYLAGLEKTAKVERLVTP